jgi:hypothetical protein
MSGASDGQTWRAPGGESATGDRQNIAEGTGGETGASVAHPVRISVHITDTRHGFIAAQNSRLPQNQSSLKTQGDDWLCRLKALDVLVSLAYRSGEKRISNRLLFDLDLLRKAIDRSVSIELADCANREGCC